VDESLGVELLSDPGSEPETDVIGREQIAILWKLMKALPANVRAMLVLRYILGWQVKDIRKTGLES
jgi:DNA-directed RNA polymerase specialized sigma24 family protein